MLAETCPGLLISPEKTSIASVGGEQVPLGRQSRKMERIQTAISGGFDARGGEEVIQAIEALVRSQANMSGTNASTGLGSLHVVPDVKDATVGRFAAGRFRSTFRSLRPLLDDRPSINSENFGEEPSRQTRLSRSELDDEAHTFALTLVEKWIADPSNVRLLRIALDLWPSSPVLSAVLKLVEPYLDGEFRKFKDRTRIALYCLSEILRAGAVETGFVDDSESMPAAVDIGEYRKRLLETAIRIATGKTRAAPWYVVQQALLYVAVHSPASLPLQKPPRGNKLYWQILSFLRGAHEELSDHEFAILAIVSRRSFLSKDGAVKLVSRKLTSGRFAEIASRDIEFAHDLFCSFDSENNQLSVAPAIAEDMGVVERSNASDTMTLRDLVHGDGRLNQIRNEVGVLSFAGKFLEQVKRSGLPEIITPSNVQISTDEVGNFAHVKQISLKAAHVTREYTSIYAMPSWAPKSQRWRFQLGYLLRFILTAKVDFSRPVRLASWREAKPIYRQTKGHRLLRHYSFYNGHEAFGDDWLPISQFTQDLLFRLLSWPGCRTSCSEADHVCLKAITSEVRTALKAACNLIGPATNTLMLKVDAPIPVKHEEKRPLRACVVQSVVPEESDFLSSDLELLSPPIRRKHRQHLSTVLAAVEKMLDLRETHKPENMRLDWLIFPELAVHPDDVATHLVPFARAFKTAILAGMVYESVVPGQPLVNSALWIIPRIVEGQGLQINIRRQGKLHLSSMERSFNSATEQKVFGFRPCQWLVGYKWSPELRDEPLWLTASICYDATDLKLASDLRDRSDVFAIPALNRDVGTFDQMAQALHYHMFQLVLIANNGAYGGSNAHMPKGEAYQRQVFLTHGQPQATISFFEINNIATIKNAMN